MRLTCGRYVLDDEGVHRLPLLWFFGAPFSVPWNEIVGWNLVEVLAGRGDHRRIVSQALVLHTSRTNHSLAGEGDELTEIVEEVRRRMPEKQID